MTRFQLKFVYESDEIQYCQALLDCRALIDFYIDDMELNNVWCELKHGIGASYQIYVFDITVPQNDVYLEDPSDIESFARCYANPKEFISPDKDDKLTFIFDTLAVIGSLNRDIPEWHDMVSYEDAILDTLDKYIHEEFCLFTIYDIDDLVEDVTMYKNYLIQLRALRKAWE